MSHPQGPRGAGCSWRRLRGRSRLCSIRHDKTFEGTDANIENRAIQIPCVEIAAIKTCFSPVQRFLKRPANCATDSAFENALSHERCECATTGLGCDGEWPNDRCEIAGRFRPHWHITLVHNTSASSSLSSLSLANSKAIAAPRMPVGSKRQLAWTPDQ